MKQTKKKANKTTQKTNRFDEAWKILDLTREVYEEQCKSKDEWLNTLLKEHCSFTVMVAGSRTYNDYEHFSEHMDAAFRELRRYFSSDGIDRVPTMIYTCDALGTDSMAVDYATLDAKIPLKQCSLRKTKNYNYDDASKKNIPITGKDLIARSMEAVDNAHAVVAFYHCEESPGTKATVEYAQKRGKKIHVVRVDW